uniref:Uncharacterized protein n=1 Tax=uncultured Desulfobacterium sp. TaxID=201089 RepID=E1YK75_9BACT|nr:hypothetical protein N47_E51910 [uncultured Desulfobacterium sp.]
MKIFFGVIKYGLPVLLIIASLTPAKIPLQFSLVAISLAACVSWVLWFKEQWLANILRIVIYFSIPYLIYLGQNNKSQWMNGEITIIYHTLYILMLISIVMTLKSTRRKKGFKINPTDFLILFIAIVVPNLPGVKVMQAGFIVMKIIILMFGYEVLIGELRSRLKWLSSATAVSMVIICIRGLL